ncbi:MAG TPA: hypothetical protein VF008_32960 [Niastella sp.]
MQKIYLTILVLFISLSGIAQYKKASYFEKEGRTYGLGTRFYALGDGIGTQRGYTLSFGRDSDGTQWFTGWELQYLPSYSFEVQKTDYNGVNKTIRGITKPSLFYSYNFGYFLLKNKNAEQKIKPYLTAAFTGKFLGGIKESSEDDDNADRQFGLSIGGGAGLFYYLKPWVALHAEGGYTYQFDFATEDTYNVLPKHPYVSVGFRFRIVSK